MESMSGSDDRWQRHDEQKASVGARASTGQVRREAVVGGARGGDGKECVRGSTCENIEMDWKVPEAPDTVKAQPL
jgi:hypothetical protein